MTRAATSAQMSSAPPSRAALIRQRPVIRSGGQPQQVGHDDADEADPARDGDRRAGGGGDGQHGEVLGLLHGDAEMHRRGLAHGQPVERAAKGAGADQGQQDQRAGGDDLGPGGAGQRAHLPECQVAQLLVVGGVDEDARQRPGQRRQREARQQHGRHRGAAAMGGDAIEQHDREPASGEGGDGHEVHARDRLDRGGQRGAEYDGADRAKACAGADADDARIGQRVAEEPLKHGARDRQRRPHQQAQQGAGQADVEQHHAFELGQRLARGHVPQRRPERGARGADGQAGDAGARQQQRQPDMRLAGQRAPVTGSGRASGRRASRSRPTSAAQDP